MIQDLKMWKDIDECASNPCQHGSCHGQIDAYFCECDVGYSGINCDEDDGTCYGNDNLAVNGVATATSQINTETSAARGFAGPESAWHSGRGMPQSITYKLKDKAVVCKITFLTRGKSWKDNREKDCPTNFRIEGSHDGSSFVLIKRVEGITCYKDDQIIETMLNNQVDYLSYRIFVESVPGRSHGAKYVYLRDIQMFGKTPTGGLNTFCYEGDGASYRGRKTTTKSGRICQNWVSHSPHKHYATCCTPESNPNAGLVDNFCRNPDNEPEGPWCYTTDENLRWEYCGVQKCTAET